MILQPWKHFHLRSPSASFLNKSPFALHISTLVLLRWETTNLEDPGIRWLWGLLIVWRPDFHLIRASRAEKGSAIVTSLWFRKY